MSDQTAAHAVHAFAWRHKLASWVAAAFVLETGLRWLWLFACTGYRAHHRPVMIPAGLLAVTLAIGLARLNRVCIALFLVGSAFALLAALWLQLSAGRWHPFLFAVSLAAAAFLTLLLPVVLVK